MTSTGLVSPASKTRLENKINGYHMNGQMRKQVQQTVSWVCRKTFGALVQNFQFSVHSYTLHALWKLFMLYQTKKFIFDNFKIFKHHYILEAILLTACILQCKLAVLNDCICSILNTFSVHICSTPYIRPYTYYIHTLSLLSGWIFGLLVHLSWAVSPYVLQKTN